MTDRAPTPPHTVIALALAVALGCVVSGGFLAAGSTDGAARVVALALCATSAGCILFALLRAADERARRSESALRQLREALDELPTGLEIYDCDDRLLLFNKRLVELYPWMGFDRKIGQTFESILRDSIRQGKIPPAVGREEEWLAQRLATRGVRDGPTLQSLKSGQWINTYERRTPSNFVVGVRLEVTDLVQKTRELEDSQARLQAIIQSAAAAIISTDPRGVAAVRVSGVGDRRAAAGRVDSRLRRARRPRPRRRGVSDPAGARRGNRGPLQ
jgi:PAS domain-containing protein